MKQSHELLKLMHLMLPHKLKLFLAIISSILNKLCDIVPEILIGISIDVVVNQQHSLVARFCGITNPLEQLYIVGALTALLWIFESVFEYFYLILWRSLAQDVQHTLRLSTYQHIQKLDMAYFENKTIGGLLSILNDDINQLELFLSEGPNALLQLVVNVIVMGGIFFYISPHIAFLTLIPIPFVVWIAYYFQNKLAVLYEVVRERVAGLGSHIASRLVGITTIKSYTTEEYELAALNRESLAYKRDNHRAGRVNAAYIPLVRMGILFGFIGSLVVGGMLTLQGTLAISMYSALVFLTQRFLWPFTTLTTITDMYERAMASVRRIFGILEQEQTITDGGMNDFKVRNLKGSIRFDQVSFGYNQDTQIFNDLSLTIPAHQTVAFVGSTGSGKSTIIKLLLRLYDSTNGSILLDDLDIKSVPLKKVRQAIALVSQEVYLVNGTVRENIAYGTTDASPDAIINAAQMAQAHEFIVDLPNGYDTAIGENGKNLSGGQRQRLAIARAILKNPPIFIFDEATSALDNETEAAVQQSIASLSGKHTMIIIAHRLSTVRHADIIFVMENGTIVESGNHEELLARNGAYATLWNIQTGELV